MTQGSVEPLLRCGAARSTRRRILDMPRAGKPSWGGLVLRALPIVLLASACSIGSEDLSVTPVTIHTSTRQSQADITAQARRTLADAIVATGVGYRFETTVTVEGHVTAQLSGTVAGNAARARTAPEDTFTEFVKTGTGAWVVGFGPGRITGESAGGMVPLDVLLAPSNVDVQRGGGPEMVLRAVYPGSAVGAPAEEHVEVDVTIRSGIVSRVAYEIPSGDDTAEVVTVIEAWSRDRNPTGS